MIAAAAVFLYVQTRGTTLWQDEWVWALYRRGDSAATFLDPHNQHLSLIPLAVYRLLFATAGLGDYRPYRIVVIGAHASCVVLLYVYARRRVGDAGALGASALLLFLGPAWANIIWPFQIGWLISIAGGLGALLLLDRDGFGPRVGACALIAASLASSGIGLVVLLGIGSELLWARRWRSLWIVGVPGVVYVLWWIAYQQTATESRIGLLPGFMFHEAAAALAALVGLAGGAFGTNSGTLLTWGRPLLAVAVVLAAIRVVRSRPVSSRLVGLVVMALAFWTLTAISRAFIGDEEAWASRYLYVGGLLILLIALELLEGVAVPRALAAVAALAVVAVVISNIGELRDGARFLRSQGMQTKAELGALGLTRGIVNPDYVSLVPGFPFDVVKAGPYFAAERADGSPAASSAQIAASSETAREKADTELIAIHGVRLRPLPARAARRALTGRSACHAALRAGTETPLPAQGMVLKAADAPASVGVRRFATRFQTVGRLAPHAAALLAIGADGARLQWHVRVTGGAVACPVR
jgi:hypothetical protein